MKFYKYGIFDPRKIEKLSKLDTTKTDLNETEEMCHHKKKRTVWMSDFEWTDDDSRDLLWVINGNKLPRPRTKHFFDENNGNNK